MARIITISREFGSGGRELGKRLSDYMELPVYDHEIIEMLAEQHALTPDYISSLSEKTILPRYTETIGRRFTVSYSAADQQLKLLRDQEELICSFASSDCIIIGRAADIILADRKPFNIFVYAEMAARIDRCKERSDDKEKLSEKQLVKRIRQIDRERASYRSLFADSVWGRKENYHLCVNTTDLQIKQIVPSVAAYIESWFGREAADHE